MFLLRHYEVIQYNIIKKSIIRKFKINNSTCFTTNEREDLLLVGNQEGLLKLWDVKTGELLWLFEGTLPINSVDMNEDGTKIVFSDYNSVEFYNRITRELKQFNCKYGDDVLLYDDKLVISDDGVIKFYKLYNLNVVDQILNLHYRGIVDLYINDDTMIFKSLKRLTYYNTKSKKKVTEDISNYEFVYTDDGYTWFGFKKNYCTFWKDRRYKRTFLCPVEITEIKEVKRVNTNIYIIMDDNVVELDLISGKIEKFSLYPSIDIKNGITEELKERLHCPITQQVMYDPVIASDGFTYEARAIAKWFSNHNTSPMTREIIDTNLLIPNKALKSVIDTFEVILISE